MKAFHVNAVNEKSSRGLTKLPTTFQQEQTHQHTTYDLVW